MEVDGQDGLAKQGREGAVVLGDPRLDVVEAVVALREDKDQPDGQDLTGSEGPFPVTRRVLPATNTIKASINFKQTIVLLSTLLTGSMRIKTFLTSYSSIFLEVPHAVTTMPLFIMQK